jgi:hypothetical protein
MPRIKLPADTGNLGDLCRAVEDAGAVLVVIPVYDSGPPYIAEITSRDGPIFDNGDSYEAAALAVIRKVNELPEVKGDG